MTLFRLLLIIICLFILNTECKGPCLNDQSIISRLTQHVENTAPGYSIEDDCRMYVSHPSALGGGHEAVFVDTTGHIEEAEGSHEKAFAKDILKDVARAGGGHLPVDGLPVKFHNDDTNDMFSHGPNDGRVLEHHEIFNDFIPKGDNMAYVSTPKELAESDADLHLGHMEAEPEEPDVRMHQFNDENGFQSRHGERVRSREDGNHAFYHYNYHTNEHGDDHGGGHHGGGHHDDDHHGEGHHDDHHGGEHGEHEEEGHHSEGHNGGEHGGHHGGEHESHHGGGHGEHHEENHEEEHHGEHEGSHHNEGHHGGGHGESHHGEGHHGEHHHFASEDHGETGSSGDDSEPKKKPKKELTKEHHKEMGSYTQDGKSHKVEFSEEEANPYHGKIKESDKEDKDSKSDKDDKTDKSNSSKSSKEKNQNFVFVLGGKSNNNFNNSNLPQVFKQLVNDAKILTIKYHGGDDETGDGPGSGEETLKENKLKNILKLPRFHSEKKKESEDDKNEIGKNGKPAFTDPKLMVGALKNYIKAKHKANEEGKKNDYDLGDLGATTTKSSGQGKHDIDRIAQNILNKFSTKTGDLQLPNDVVKNADEKENSIQKTHTVRCCLNTTPPPIPPQEPSLQTPPPQIVVELPQFQLYPPTAASTPSEAQPIGKQQRLQKLMRQKQKLDRLESEYERELSNFKEELKKKDVPGKDDTEEAPDLFLPKEMNGCKDSKTFEKLKECIEAAKLLLTKNKVDDDKGKEKNEIKPTGTVTDPVQYKGPKTTSDSSDDKKNDSKTVEQDSDSQSVDILGKDKKINEERKEKEKKKEDSVFQEENDNGVPEPVQMKDEMKDDEDKKKEESDEKKKNENEEKQKNKEDKDKDEEKKKEPFQMQPEDIDKDQTLQPKDDESKPNPTKVKNDESKPNPTLIPKNDESKQNPTKVKNDRDSDAKKSDDDPPTPKNEKDKEEIVKEISKLQKALSTYYRTTKSSSSSKTESTPIVLVHEIRLVKDDKLKQKEREAEKLNNNIKNLQNLLKENSSKDAVKKCGSFFLKGQLIFDKDCDEKRRSRIRRKQKHKKKV